MLKLRWERRQARKFGVQSLHFFQFLKCRLEKNVGQYNLFIIISPIFCEMSCFAVGSRAPVSRAAGFTAHLCSLGEKKYENKDWPFHSTRHIQVIRSAIKISSRARNHYRWQWWMAGEKRNYQTAQKKITFFMGIKENERKSTFYDILRSHEQTRGCRADWVSARLIRFIMKRWQDKYPHARLILIFSWHRIQRRRDRACYEIQPDQLRINPTVFVSLLVRCQRLLSAACPIRMDQVTADAWKRHMATHQHQDHLRAFPDFPKVASTGESQAQIQDSLIQNWFDCQHLFIFFKNSILQ